LTDLTEAQTQTSEATCSSSDLRGDSTEDALVVSKSNHAQANILTKTHNLPLGHENVLSTTVLPKSNNINSVHAEGDVSSDSGCDSQNSEIICTLPQQNSANGHPDLSGLQHHVQTQTHRINNQSDVGTQQGFNLHPETDRSATGGVSVPDNMQQTFDHVFTLRSHCARVDPFLASYISYLEHRINTEIYAEYDNTEGDEKN
jgi:hypothetical protein